MKIIKIILSIIIGLSLIFFATGIIIKETKYTVEVSINKSVEQVFTEFSKIENSKNWIPDVKKITTIQETQEITGNSYQVVVDNNGEEFIITESILDYEPNQKITIFFDAENMLKNNNFVFQSQGTNKTRIVLEATCKSDSYMLSCVFPYFKSVFSKQDLAYLENFKTYVEAL